MTRVVVDPERPDPDIVARVAATLRAGGVAAIPTDTLYGLAVDAWNSRAVARIFAIKGRGTDRALPLIAADAEQVQRWIGAMEGSAKRLATAFWPGPLTLVMRAPDGLPMEVTAGGPTVGIRVPAQNVARALCAAVGRPLTATSANASGEPPTADPDAVADLALKGVDVLVDAGRTPGGPASTIVDISSSEPRLIRAGAVSWAAVKACL